MPYYEDNNLDSNRRESQDLHPFFEAPYSRSGPSDVASTSSEAANSSKYYLVQY